MIVGDARQIPLADESVQSVVTSPPYWGPRDYGVAGQIGLEKTPEEYVAALVAVFREVRRVLKAGGTLWCNLGDSYAAGGNNAGSRPEDTSEKQRSNAGCRYERRAAPSGLKPGDIVFDPFAGSGTTVSVAYRLGRKGLGLELSQKYVHEQALPRTRCQLGLPA